MDYATMQSILGWAAIAAALIAGGIVGAMLVYDLGKPLWRRLARLWRRSPVECVAAVALLCYCVAWGGGKITFPRTNAEYELLKDNGSYVADDWGWIAFTPHPILPKTADIQLWRRDASSTNDADWVLHHETNLGTSYVFDFYIKNASNYNYMVFTTWQPAPAVQTNGVLHVDWVVATNAETAAASTHALAAVPLKSTVAFDGAEAWPNADFDATPVTARSYVQDGLVAMWDGIENAGWGVHDPNATNWVDLVGGQQARIDSSMNGWARVPIGTTVCFTDSTETNTATLYWTKTSLRGTHTFSGKSPKGEGIRALAEPSPVLDCATATVEAVTSAYEPSATYARRYTPVGWSADYADTLYNGPLWLSADLGFRRLNDDPTEPILSQSVSVFSTNSVAHYLDGRLTATSTKFTRIRHKQPMLMQMGANCVQREDLYCARYYNRALTPDEIAHNAAIDRRRFGTAANAK